MKKILLLAVSHGLFTLFGFALGIYALPILTAPAAPQSAQINALMQEPRFQGEFRRDLSGSDWLHWGEGKLLISENSIALQGELAPGPDYRLYLSPEFVENEAEFLALKDRMVQVGEVKTFENFLLPLSQDIQPERYKAAVVWCETFGQFISAATYR